MQTAGVYPSICDEDDIFDTHLVPTLLDLRNSYAAAAADGEVMVQIIC